MTFIYMLSTTDVINIYGTIRRPLCPTKYFNHFVTYLFVYTNKCHKDIPYLDKFFNLVIFNHT